MRGKGQIDLKKRPDVLEVVQHSWKDWRVCIIKKLVVRRLCSPKAFQGTEGLHRALADQEDQEDQEVEERQAAEAIQAAEATQGAEATQAAEDDQEVEERQGVKAIKTYQVSQDMRDMVMIHSLRPIISNIFYNIQ